MSNKDEPGFYQGTRRYVGLLLAAAPLFALSKFVQGKLALDWRRWLTEHLCGMYFSNLAFYSLKNGLHTLRYPPALENDKTKDGQDEDGDGRVESKRLSRKGEEQGGAIDNPISTVDNPDQRIGEDVSSFTQNCISVLVVLVGSVLKMGSFVGVLLSISPQLTAFVAVYSLAGTFTTTYMFGAQLKHLIFEGAKREANFRFGLVRVREHAEEIAFYRGEKKEETDVRSLLDRVGHFMKKTPPNPPYLLCGIIRYEDKVPQYPVTCSLSVVSNIHQRLWCDAQLAVVQNSFMWFTAVLPYLAVAHRYFSGEVEFGVISQTAMAFRVIQNALSVVVTQIRTLASLASEVDRLHFLLMTIEEMQQDPKSDAKFGLKAHEDGDSDYVAVPGEDIDEPVEVGIDDEGYQELKDDRGGDEMFEVRSEGAFLDAGGDSTAVQQTSDGSSAATDGLTSVAVTKIVVEGLRKGGDGSASSVLEMEKLTLFTPDRKRMICRQLSFAVQPDQSLLIFGPSGCGKSSLLRAISGLWTAGEGTVRRHTDEKNMFIPQKPYLPLGSLKTQMLYPTRSEWSLLTDSALEGILQEVQLGYLFNRYGGLGVTRDWQDELSLGEQQRLAFSRLLTNTPSMVFLDEATSALDEANEAKLYQLVNSVGVAAFVSVGHRSSLFRYHTHVLRGQSDGQWFFHTMKDFVQNHYTPGLPRR